MGIHLPIKLVEWVERQRCTAPVEQGYAGVARAAGTPPYWRKVRDMLGEHHLRVPVQSMFLVHIKTGGQPPQVTAERGDFITRIDRFHTGAKHGIGKLHAPTFQLLLILAGQVKNHVAPVQLVFSTDQFPGFVDRFTGQGGGLIVTD
ncbi:hypothetical protein PSTA9_04269 [Pseudomonas syringae pv. tomato]|nr:hypothetical protein PSTA9_04269 [Pseudomonas syringae pv. tomato]